MRFFVLTLLGLCLILAACGTPADSVIATAAETPTVLLTPVPQATPSLTASPSSSRDSLCASYTHNVTEFPQRNPSFIAEEKIAIDYTFNLLMLCGFEWGFSYDNAVYTPVVFPDGAKGVFVAFGFSGVARGYRILYKIEGDEFRVVQLSEDDRDWGMNWGKDLGRSADVRVDLQFPDLLRDKDGKHEPLIQLSGATHHGTGLWTNGDFEIYKVTNEGLHTIFSGTPLIATYGYLGDLKEYTYDYTDLDSDGNKEIIKEGQECQFTDYQDNAWQFTNCKPVYEIYKYNGDVYVKQS